jgi:plasmid stabilization system protein ParE
MALTVRWTDRARAHLRDILDYTAFDNPDAAKALARKVFTSVDRLADFPHAGRRLPELEDAPFRERVVPPCRVIYQVRGDTLLILVVLRTERRLVPQMLDH